ncbi:hypothetical protein B7494_g310 [Chlorociboria aeruginascens]|nr:hypothetical protein B7494_g310 [Chlorociboria aeruginascens]
MIKELDNNVLTVPIDKIEVETLKLPPLQASQTREGNAKQFLWVRLKWRHAKDNENALLSFDPTVLDPIGSKQPDSSYRYPISEANQLY